MGDVRLEPVADPRATLGEGPVWDVEQSRIYWVDSLGGTIWSCRDDGRELRTWTFDGMIGSMVLRDDGSAILAADTGVLAFDFETGRTERIADLPVNVPGVRLNDGKVDRRGRFLFGSILSGEPRNGGLYRLDPDFSVTTLDSAMAIVNGPCWSPDDSTFYLTDSMEPNREIWRYDYDIETGAVSNRSTFSTVEGPAVVVADGATVDAEGFVWSARYNASAVVRLAPDGSVDRVVPLPMQSVTSVAFGGPDLDVLFVTSSARIMTASLQDHDPGRYAGQLVAVHGLGVVGLPERRFGG